ncbi:MAG: hypothetical protein QM703_28760 [Gemmatales bacterium]
MKKALKKNDSTGLAVAGGVAAGAAAGSFLGPLGAAAGAAYRWNGRSYADPIMTKATKAKTMPSVMSMKAKPSKKKATSKKTMSNKVNKTKKKTASVKRKK